MYLDLGLDILDGVAGLYLQSDRLPRQGLHEDLHFVFLPCTSEKESQRILFAWGKLEREGCTKI
jgi:hypothetical protein